jgi:D-alanyl-D-alanine carboxypeptidase (penicillin-binding protein 5/6)
MPLASITKLMTTLLAYELADQAQITSVLPEAIDQEGNFGLSVGEQLTLQKLQQMSLITSSNDAAYQLAASVGSLLGEQDPYQQFIAGMNIRAQELGLNTLEFLNPTGLDVSANVPGAVGSAKDVSFLMEYIITNYPEIIYPTREDSIRVYNLSGAFHDITNTNQIVTEIPNLIGSKTGFTDLAGGNLTIAFDAGLNRPIIVTVLGSTRSERFNDVSKIIGAVQSSVGN